MPDREKVIKDLEEYRDREFVKEGITVFDNDPRYRKLIIGNALTMLKEQPEIVRCKDCKYAAPDMACSHESEWGNEISRNRCNPNWFCADGLRKEVK